MKALIALGLLTASVTYVLVCAVRAADETKEIGIGPTRHDTTLQRTMSRLSLPVWGMILLTITAMIAPHL